VAAGLADGSRYGVGTQPAQGQSPEGVTELPVKPCPRSTAPRSMPSGLAGYLARLSVKILPDL